MPRSLGERRVRIGPGDPAAGFDQAGRIKRLAADLIDEIAAIGADGYDGEVHRWKALAQTHAEEAAMWAVKAATAPPAEDGGEET